MADPVIPDFHYDPEHDTNDAYHFRGRPGQPTRFGQRHERHEANKEQEKSAHQSL